jgi:putative molybdopterin biosynthesis protein
MGVANEGHSPGQTQFLTVVDRDEAERRFRAALELRPLPAEIVPLVEAHERVLAEDVIAGIDVPGFDRANVDGFAVRAADTFGAMEESPKQLRLNGEVIEPGDRPQETVATGWATQISTGAIIPRGADAVVMVEDTDPVAGAAGARPDLLVTRAVGPGENISFAGSDIARGETILFAGQMLTSRELGVLAALGRDRVNVVRRPRVGILSTGNELAAAGEALEPGRIYDSNGPMLAAAVRECGGKPVLLGIVRDTTADLEARVREGLACDVLLLSGGTSKGAGDLSYRVVAELRDPGIVVHGVALKPGKPLCLAVTQGKPVAVLPGFPTSALFTFHEFLAPVIRRLAGRGESAREELAARSAVKLPSDKGRTEYVLVSLTPGAEGEGPIAFPLGKGSGSVTTFSQADGFVTIDQRTEFVDAGADVAVTLMGRQTRAADLVLIGSHCVGVDYLVGRLNRSGLVVKTLAVGSLGGLTAAKKGHCDIAGMHLLDPATGEYNRSFVGDGLELVRGYERMQGLLFRRNDARFTKLAEGHHGEVDLAKWLGPVVSHDGCLMVNRNPGSGTRLLIDGLLERMGNGRPAGYAYQVKSHNAVAAAISQGRADWGIAIQSVAESYGLAFVPWQAEQYDFVLPVGRRSRPAVRAFLEMLDDVEVRAELARGGCERRSNAK